MAWTPANVLAAVAALVLVLGAGMALIGAARIGISTDEPVHQSRMNVWFETGWYLPERFFDDSGRPDPEIEPGRRHSYGAAHSLFGHAVAVLAGAEEPGRTNRSAAAYNVRGVAGALLGIAAAAAVGFATTVLANSRVAGLWAAAATMAMPLWTGYSMFAVKDIPAGAGWTAVTAGLVVALHPSPGRWRQVVIALMCGGGVWFSFGVRTALWVPLVVGVSVFAVLAAARWRTVRGNVIAVAIGLAVGAVAVTAVHYRNAATPVEWLVNSVRTSADFQQTGATLTFGRLLTEKPPWWYLPAWIGGSMPLLIGLLAATGFMTAVVVVARRSAGGPLRGRLGFDGAAMALWGVQAIMLPVGATLIGATMYAGLRQHLYVLPALAALAAYAASQLLRRWGARWLVVVVLALVLVVPTMEQLQLYPYQYVYKNAVAGPINDRWESDMHLVSGREALTRVPVDVDAWCYKRSVRLLSGELRQPGLRLCSTHRQLLPFIAEQGSQAQEAAAVGGLYVIGRKYRGSPPAPGCSEWDSVTRPLRGEDIVLTYVLVCDPDQYG